MNKFACKLSWHIVYFSSQTLSNTDVESVLFAGEACFKVKSRNGPIPVSVSEISAHFSVSAVSVSAI